MDVELDHGFFQEEPATTTNLCLHNTLPTCLTERLFNNLTALVLINLWDTPFLSEFIRIFRATTHLEFLHLENADCVPDAEYDDTDIALPFLRHLYIGRTTGGTFSLISHIRAPALAFLTFCRLSNINLMFVVRAAPTWAA